MDNLHVAFESVERCEEDRCYGSSIPLSKALDEFGDVLLAYEMNGAPLTLDHGYPIRVVVPGYIGARSVKYLKTITVQEGESNAYFQQTDYKILPEQVETEKQAAAYWDKCPSIGEYNVQSYVCHVEKGVATGYALAGGGRSIQRVDVSGDDGKSWVLAELCQPHEGPRAWGWCLWTARVKQSAGVPVVCRAVDSAGNIQQEHPLWNYRGVMNNAWRDPVPPNL
ncbi:Oxidoreductase, molybdopterin-binding domain-containing protein [Syncephalastrum racemosum]|uniref:Oxidoreductase, molybdopterin-binding domain-containing protein n=1 Tax=Syncephalastrum racemosum TaxID=13706 RepID=A0A1X2HCX1_SYNRA|nr:Oxidoreductase, molybdopterin-binding domain-containing protein [Syncephalastrum racemosum]